MVFRDVAECEIDSPGFKIVHVEQELVPLSFIDSLHPMKKLSLPPLPSEHLQRSIFEPLLKNHTVSTSWFGARYKLKHGSLAKRKGSHRPRFEVPVFSHSGRINPFSPLRIRLP